MVLPAGRGRLGGDVEVAIDLARAEFKFKLTVRREVENRSRSRGFKRYPGWGHPDSIFRKRDAVGKQDIVKLF